MRTRKVGIRDQCSGAYRIDTFLEVVLEDLGLPSGLELHLKHFVSGMANSHVFVSSQTNTKMQRICYSIHTLFLWLPNRGQIQMRWWTSSAELIRGKPSVLSSDSEGSPETFHSY